MTLKFIFTISFFILSSWGLNTNEFNIAPVKFVDKSNYMKYDSVDKIPTKLFNDIDNIFVLKDGTQVVHAKKFNTIERTSGDKFSLFDDSPDVWYQTSGLDVGQAKVGKSFPLTPKVKNSHGDGGSISFTYEIIYGRNLAFDLPHVVDFSRIVGLIGVGTEHYTSFKMSGTYTCNLIKGENGQIFSQPYEYEYSGYKIRQIIPIQKTLVGMSYIQLQYGDWQINNESFTVVDTRKTPHISCIKS